MTRNVGVQSIENLREFSSYLRNLSFNLSNEFDSARKAMYDVSEGWDDEENVLFMQEFEQTVEIINRIAGRMDEYGAFLSKKCDALEHYKSIRI